MKIYQYALTAMYRSIVLTARLFTAGNVSIIFVFSAASLAGWLCFFIYENTNKTQIYIKKGNL